MLGCVPGGLRGLPMWIDLIILILAPERLNKFQALFQCRQGTLSLHPSSVALQRLNFMQWLEQRAPEIALDGSVLELGTCFAAIEAKR